MGTRFIGWIDDEHILTHEFFSLPKMSSKQYGQATTQPWVFPMLASVPRHDMGLDDLKHGNQRYIFVLEQVLLGGLYINTLLAHDFSKMQ